MFRKSYEVLESAWRKKNAKWISEAEKNGEYEEVDTAWENSAEYQEWFDHKVEMDDKYVGFGTEDEDCENGEIDRECSAECGMSEVMYHMKLEWGTVAELVELGWTEEMAWEKALGEEEAAFYKALKS